MANNEVVTNINLEQYGLKKIASGKVREIFEVDQETLLFVATDRISAYDVIMENVGRFWRIVYFISLRPLQTRDFKRQHTSPTTKK